MADKDPYNDEYQFADLDAISPDTPSDPAETLSPNETASDSAMNASEERSIVKRNALIVVAIVVVIMILYKVFGSIFSDNNQVKTITPVKSTATTIPKTVASSPSPVPPVARPVITIQPQIEQKISALELGQENVRSDVATVNTQLTSINSNVTTMVDKMTALNNMIAQLAAKVESQSEEIDRLRIRQVTVHRHTTPRVRVHYPNYFIQAVIPGRAWLVASNGATLTVRDGSTISGYGVVKLIDPNQGRVLTSSGRVIRFSQDDS